MPAEKLEKYRAGVGMVLRNKEGSFFAGTRFEDDSAFSAYIANTVQMPQGGIEQGETEEQALERELKEEVGLDMCDVKLVGKMPNLTFYELPQEMMYAKWHGLYIGQKHRWFLLDVLNESKINIATTDPEFESYEWLTAQQLIDRGAIFKKDAYRLVFDFVRSLPGRGS